MKSSSISCARSAAGLVLIFVLFSSCASDLDIMKKGQPVPVVYAMINPYDTVHYVRVQKTFKINVQEDWLTLNPDSLQFEDVEVNLYGKVGDSVKWAEHFVEVKAEKEEGFFPSGDYRVFMLDHKLPITITGETRKEAGIPDLDSLVLEVQIADLDLITRASAKALCPTKIINYKSRYLIYVYGSFPSVYALPPTEETPDPDFEILYQQINFRVHYKEHYFSGVSTKEISWIANQGWDDNAYFITPERILDPIRERINDHDSILYRTLDSIDIALMRPSKFFNQYWYLHEKWGDNDYHPCTNFDHSYGMFFTYVQDEWTGMQLNWQAMDSLCNGQYYKQLKFRQ